MIPRTSARNVRQALGQDFWRWGNSLPPPFRPGFAVHVGQRGHLRVGPGAEDLVLLAEGLLGGVRIAEDDGGPAAQIQPEDVAVPSAAIFEHVEHAATAEDVGVAAKGQTGLRSTSITLPSSLPFERRQAWKSLPGQGVLEISEQDERDQEEDDGSEDHLVVSLIEAALMLLNDRCRCKTLLDVIAFELGPLVETAR